MKVFIWSLTKAERKHLISQFTLVELFKELHRRALEDDEEELEEEEGKEFSFESDDEMMYAYEQLASKYPHEVPRLIYGKALRVPFWLQKEILERRVKKDV